MELQLAGQPIVPRNRRQAPPNGRYTPPVTVAAVILSATIEDALTDTRGQPRVRRLVDLAWSGGALPVMVLSPDGDGAVAAALAGTEAVWGPPAPPEAGPVGQMIRGAELSLIEVRETTAFLIWPAQMIWVGPETITSLIEAHGAYPAALLRPGWRGEAGWPVLLPATCLDALRAISADRMPPDIVADLLDAVPSRVLEVGDPGVTHDADTPFDALPAYQGPPDPPRGHAHEWGADVAAEAGLPEP